MSVQLRLYWCYLVRDGGHSRLSGIYWTDHFIFLLHLSPAQQVCNVFWTKFHSAESALDNVRRTLPDITDQREIAEGERIKRFHPTIVQAKSCNQVSLALLYLASAEHCADARSREKALAMTHQMAEDSRKMSTVATFKSFSTCHGVS